MTSQRDVDERGGGSADHNTRERLLADLPVTERRIQLAGISSAVLEGGDGPPVILLHGPGEFAALWGRVIPDLARIHRFVWCGGVILSVSRCYRLRHGVAAGLAASVFHIRVVVPVETGPVVRWSLRLVGR